MSGDPSITPDQLLAQLDALSKEFATAIEPLTGEQDIRVAQARYLGKKGKVSSLMKLMGKMPAAERPRIGEAFNRVKSGITDAVAARLEALEQAEKTADLARVVDVTLPGRESRAGHFHLLTQVRDELSEIFSELGFAVAEGPQIDTDFHCFEALAMPKGHPARAMQDTFYVSDEIVLRPHTSPVQIRTMLAQKPPVKIVAPGVVYRRDDDVTHSPVFMQIEGLLVDRVVRMSDLKGIFLHFVRRFFGKALEVRFRPSYFPFVEPGVEVDMRCSFCMGQAATCRLCKGTGWIEITGAGMVDPEVLAHVGYDHEEYTGLAWGMGIERIAMLRHNVTDIKYYYVGDVRFVRQF